MSASKIILAFVSWFEFSFCKAFISVCMLRLLWCRSSVCRLVDTHGNNVTWTPVFYFWLPSSSHKQQVSDSVFQVFDSCASKIILGNCSVLLKKVLIAVFKKTNKQTTGLLVGWLFFFLCISFFSKRGLWGLLFSFYLYFSCIF